jgi:hypothetical protein
MRTCAHCRRAIDEYRRDAVFCGGPCRAAASRARARQVASTLEVGLRVAYAAESAQSRTHEATATGPEATTAEATGRAFRVLVPHADLMGEVA